jgi:hypothetical protein
MAHTRHALRVAEYLRQRGEIGARGDLRLRGREGRQLRLTAEQTLRERELRNRQQRRMVPAQWAGAAQDKGWRVAPCAKQNGVFQMKLAATR